MLPNLKEMLPGFSITILDFRLQNTSLKQKNRTQKVEKSLSYGRIISFSAILKFAAILKTCEKNLLIVF
jgi:hypothetical protein